MAFHRESGFPCPCGPFGDDMRRTSAGRAGKLTLPPFGGLTPYGAHVGGYDVPCGDNIAAKIECYERLRAQMSEAKMQTEMLFQSLLTQSFSAGLSEAFKN